MKLPIQLVPTLVGAIGGAMVLAILGFTWFGWVSASKAEFMADKRAGAAVVAALTPICVEKFKESADAAKQLEALKKFAYYWEKGSFVEKGGWATFAGETKPNPDVARACAEALEKQNILQAGPSSEPTSRP
jgi:hypothetical protein